MNCGVCGAPSAGGQFCIGCGEPLSSAVTSSRAAVGTRERARPAPGAWLALQEIRLLACPKCGAPNSAARWRCARCGHTFDDRDHEGAASAETAAADQPVTTVQPESARWLVLITAAAAVAVVAVAVMMLTARGIGPFGPQDAPAALTAAEPIVIDSVEASDRGADDSTMANLVDGDPTTAWRVAGVGVGEWIELRFRRPVQIDHLLLWNGDQRGGDSFAAANRIKGLVIEFPDTEKVYKVDQLPDRGENVRVTMSRRPPVSDVIRLQITSVHEGRTGMTALSEIQALAHQSAESE